ncbi:hypothetical protein [Curtobacterium sp. 1544]|uniref:hypothetical protein n=1 Tax=Curtobacterium sp. 1544 TaxID=3156417 RepID=UPI003394C7EF
MTDELNSAWYTVFAALTWITPTALLAWFAWLYVLFLSQGTRGGALTLSRAERRWLRDEDDDEMAARTRWSRFRSQHLAPARAVEAANRARFVGPLWLALTCGGGCLALAAFLAWSSIVNPNVGGTGALALASSFFSAVPLLATALIRRRVWMWRARTQWQVVLLCDRLAEEAERDVDQDLIARRSGLILSTLARRIPAGRSTITSEERLRWMNALQPAVITRARLVAADHTRERRWSNWVRDWNEQIARAFHPSASKQSTPDVAVDGIERRDNDSQGLAWLIVVCMSFTALGIVLAAATDDAIDMQAIWAWWDSAAGRITTTISGIGGLLGIATYFRHRSARR